MTAFGRWLWRELSENDPASWIGHGYQGLAYTVIVGGLTEPWAGLLVAMMIFVHREAPTLIAAVLSALGVVPRPAKGLDSAMDYLTPVAGGLAGVAGLLLLGFGISLAVVAGVGVLTVAGFYAIWLGDER